MKANRLTAIGLVAGAALWIVSGHLMPSDSATEAPTRRAKLSLSENAGSSRLPSSVKWMAIWPLRFFSAPITAWRGMPMKVPKPLPVGASSRLLSVIMPGACRRLLCTVDFSERSSEPRLTPVSAALMR